MEVGPANTPGAVGPYRGDYDYTSLAGIGLKYSDMSSATRSNLVPVMKEYVYNMTTTLADVW